MNTESNLAARADPRNPYNDPTLPYYNPDLGKEKAADTSQQKEKPAPPPSADTSQQKEKPASPSSTSGTIPGADPRNPYNDPTLPYYNPDLGKEKR